MYENYPLEEALDIYIKACEQEIDDKYWDLYLIHIQHSESETSFESFKKKQKALSKSKTMSDEELEVKRNEARDIREKIRNQEGTTININTLKRALK